MFSIISNKINSNKAPFFFTLGVYICWLLWLGPNHALSNFIEQISIAITMLFGSIVAGGTALGGGAVAFPVMTKLLNIDVATAKIFSLAIQSFGMTAASITIIFSGIKYYKKVVFFALCGAIPGVLFSLTFISELLPRLITKSVFSACLIFFAITLFKLQLKKNKLDSTLLKKPFKARLIMACGFCGGIISGLIGSGADIAIFALLMLYYKSEMKVATATSVIIMAATSIVATLFNHFHLSSFNLEVTNYVFAAIPVVVIGAPLGAYLCAKAQERSLLYILYALITMEVCYTLFEIMT